MYYIKIQFSPHFLPCLQCKTTKFMLQDPDPHITWQSGSRRENGYGSMLIRIHSPDQ